MKIRMARAAAPAICPKASALTLSLVSVAIIRQGVAIFVTSVVTNGVSKGKPNRAQP